YGGFWDENGFSLALDASNNVYVTGYTTSSNGISTAGAYRTSLVGGQNIFVAKFNSSGSSLLWGTYYGGGNSDLGDAIAIDASNNVYITGLTQSTSGIATIGTYQTSNAGGQDAFVAKFNPTGSSLIWGTYYGGPSNDYAGNIALDAAGNVYITGVASSTTGIATAGAYQT